MIGRYNRLSRPRNGAKDAQRLPLYQQLREFLNEKIESGEWQPGHQLPTELQLSSEFGVSRVTVRQAMELLERQGLVERKQGRGTFVGRPKLAHNLLAMFTSGADFRRTGQVPQLGLYELKQVDAPASVQAHLKLEAGARVYQLRRTLRADNEPLMLINSWLPVSLLPGLEDRGLNHRTIREVLLDYGITATHQYKEVEVTMVDEEEADLLATRPGLPALLMTYVSEQHDGIPFEYRKMVVRGDRCKYYVDINLPEPLL